MTMSLLQKIKRAWDNRFTLEGMERKKYEEAFRLSIEEMQTLYRPYSGALQGASFPEYPKAIDLESALGVFAVGLNLDMEVDQYPIFWNELKQDRDDVKPWHFRRVDNEIERHTLVNSISIRSGRLVRLVTNDLDVIRLAASKRFTPPPPWLVWYEDGPRFSYMNQGEPEFWYMTTWKPFWSSLTVDEQTVYLRRKREENKAYLSDDDWRAWVVIVRLADARTSPAGWED